MKIDRRVPKSREAIKSAFIALMAEKSFDVITIGQISKRANVNRGTIYAHYIDKQDLLEKCVEEQFVQLMNSCGARDGNAVGYPTFTSLLSTSQYFEANFLFYASMLNNKGMITFRARLLDVMTTGIAEQVNMRAMNHRLDKDILVQFMAAAIVGIVEWWIVNKMPVSAETMATNLWQILERNEITSA